MRPLAFPSVPDLEALRDRGKVITEEDLEREQAAARQADQEARERRLLEQIPPRYRGCTLDSWQGHEAAKQRALGWDPSQSWCLVCFGQDNGVGKSHLATSIWRRFALRLRPAYWRSVPQLLDEIYRGFDGDAPSPAVVMDRMARAGLLLLDHLGQQHKTAEDARARISMILCERYDHQRPTIITTNLKQAELAAWDPALADRVYSSESVIVGRQGESWRRR